jgi:chitin deacetylase
MPNVPVSLPNNGYPTYAGGEKGSDSVICSFTYACTTPEDLYNAPDGIVAVSSSFP